MDFSLNDEQQMLADSVSRFLEREYDMAQRRALVATPPGYSLAHWQSLADMGLLALNVPEDAGGLGASAVETMLVMQAFGRGLVVEPFVPTAVIGASLIAAGAPAGLREDLLAALAGGELRIAVATNEPDARFDLWHVSTRARKDGGGWLIDGRKCVVIAGDSAGKLIVPARTAGEAGSPDGISLFLVDARAQGLEVAGFPGMDGLRSAEITLAGVRAEALLGEEGRGYPLLESAVDRGIAALCAEAVGAMERALEMTAQYLNQRVQFGQPLAKFQALQHRIADMSGALEQARAVALAATAGVDGDDRDARRRAVSTAKVIIGQSGRFIGESAIHLHGGMGMSDEMDIGLYFKRLRCIDMTLGDSDHHMELYSALMLPAR